MTTDGMNMRECSSEPPVLDDVVAELLEQFLASLRSGEQVSIAEFVARHPRYHLELSQVLPAVAAMEGYASHQLSSSGRWLSGPAPGDRLGEFEIRRELGRGGMGVVYEAVQESLGRVVALKVLPPSTVASVRGLRRFHDEARTASSLSHPHIVPVFAFGEAEGLPYYAMQRVAGVGLDRVLAALQAPDAAIGDPLLQQIVAEWQDDDDLFHRVARLGIAVADALENAHRHGVLHRDVKPSNVLVEVGGKPWVADFGIAKIVDGTDAQCGEFVGTLRYAAPEQLEGHCDARTDVHGLALVLFELAARSAVFSNDGIRTRALGDDMPVRRLRHFARKAPADLETVLAKAMARQPADRYPSAARLAADLRRFVDGRPIEARVVSYPERLWRWSRRHRLASALAVATAASIVATAIVGWQGYLSTQRALDREKAAVAIADGNKVLAQASLDSIFAAVAGGLGALPAADERDVSRLRPLSHHELELLTLLLDYYERFAEANTGDARLAREAAEACCRAGDIHRWSGDLRGAAKSYRRVITHFEALAPDETDESWRLLVVGALQSLAGVTNTLAGPWQAFPLLERARELLKAPDAGESYRRRRIELVRLDLVLARIALSNQPMLEYAPDQEPSMPYGAGLSTARRCTDEAVAIASELLAAAGDDSALRLLYARSLRTSALVLRLARPEEATTPLVESLRQLDGLGGATPDPAILVESAETASLCAVLRDSPDSAANAARALAAARHLVELVPAPDREDLLGRVLRRSAMVALREGRNEAARGDLRSCIEVRELLRLEQPDDAHHLCELLAAYRLLGRVELASGDEAAARESLQEGVAIAQSVKLERLPISRAVAGLKEVLERDLRQLR